MDTIYHWHLDRTVCSFQGKCSDKKNVTCADKPSCSEARLPPIHEHRYHYPMLAQSLGHAMCASFPYHHQVVAVCCEAPTMSAPPPPQQFSGSSVLYEALFVVLIQLLATGYLNERPVNSGSGLHTCRSPTSGTPLHISKWRGGGGNPGVFWPLPPDYKKGNF